MGAGETVTLRALVEAEFRTLRVELASLRQLVDERDRLYGSQFAGSRTAVDAALTAQKEQVAAAFLASEKAIVKAEDAQREYNVRSNEFRGQLDDQAKTLMPRPESAALFRAADEKLAFIQQSFESKLEQQRLALDKNNDTFLKALGDLRLSITGFLPLDTYEARHSELQHQVNDLRESRSQVEGRGTGTQQLWAGLVAGTGILIAVVAIVVSVALR
jgi:hypothetical protein